MAGTIISGNSSIGITLNDTASNPVSVTGNITNVSSIALYGMGGTITGQGGTLYGWTIDNSGTITSTGSSAVGLGSSTNNVTNSGVTNEAGGFISGTVGVYIRGPGSVTNISGGSITGTGDSAVLIGIGLGTIVNGGALLGGTYGIDEQQGGSVSNLSGATKGTISGSAAGVHIAGAAGGMINNAGVILGSNYGTDEIFGGSVTNQASASITGTAKSGIYMQSGLGTVINSGTLYGGLFGVNEQVGGSVTNLSGGVITGAEGDGVRILGASGAVYNANSIVSGYIGVLLGHGGSVTNVSSGLISGTGTVGVAISAAPGVVINTGSVYGFSTGVLLADGGSVTNNTGGTISGNTYAAVAIFGGPGVVVNNGVMNSNSDGVVLGHGGSVTNNVGHAIAGNGNFGVAITGSAGGALNNFGFVLGKSYGVYMQDGGGGSLTNQSSGTIVSYLGGGVLVDSADTVTNAGTIIGDGPSGVAVQFSGPNGTLVVDPGAVFSGKIAGASGDTFELGGSTASTLLAGFDGASITNFSTLQFDPNALWTISGSSGASGLGTINISGFDTNDTIDLTDFTSSGAGAVFAGNKLVLTDDDGSTTLNMMGSFASGDFSFAADGGGSGPGTYITVTATCFAAGTRIRTTHGEVAVEELCEGDQALTVSGEAQPIRWIGHRHVNFLNHPNRQRILPVCIAAHAFGRGMPERVLMMSPDHAVFVEDVLIPIRHLLNGTTVTQFYCDSITYYHVELPRHDVLLAEGMPAESYLEAGARDAFANFEGAIQLYPEYERPRDHYAMLWESEGYAPLMIAGEQLKLARRNLARQAALLIQTRDALIAPLSPTAVAA